MMDWQELMACSATPSEETRQAVRQFVERYPYFQAARMLYLKQLHDRHDPLLEEALHESAIYITDRAFLYQLLEGRCEERGAVAWASQAKTIRPQGNRTLTLIDAFLAQSPETSTDMPWEGEIVTDYTPSLLQEDVPDEVTPLRGQELIDRFIERSEKREVFRPRTGQDAVNDPDLPAYDAAYEKTVAQDAGSEVEDESYFTETLAKIYIKQQRYAKALEIIKKLRLKYPKKNAYFADQIKSLEKLIINTKSK